MQAGDLPSASREMTRTTTSPKLPNYKITRCLSDSLERRIPDEFVNLQSEPCRNIVGQHPLGQLLRIDEAMRGIARAVRIFAEGGRKQHGIHAFRQALLLGKIARKFVVHTIADDELHFIVGRERLEIREVERIGFAGMRTLDVDDLDDTFRDSGQRALA